MSQEENNSCMLRILPPELQAEANRVALEENPDNNLGTDCLLISKNEPTMNFGWFTASTKPGEYSRTVLHEFGHALGCPHEHSSPTANIPWDKEAVYRYYMAPPNNWTKEQIDYNLFFKYSLREAFATAFDPESIMVYPIPNSQTIGDFEVKMNTVLSETDKQFISRMYPAGNLAERHLATTGAGHRAANPQS